MKKCNPDELEINIDDITSRLSAGWKSTFRRGLEKEALLQQLLPPHPLPQQDRYRLEEAENEVNIYKSFSHF